MSAKAQRQGRRRQLRKPVPARRDRRPAARPVRGSRRGGCRKAPGATQRTGESLGGRGSARGGGRWATSGAWGSARGRRVRQRWRGPGDVGVRAALPYQSALQRGPAGGRARQWRPGRRLPASRCVRQGAPSYAAPSSGRYRWRLRCVGHWHRREPDGRDRRRVRWTGRGHTLRGVRVEAGAGGPDGRRQRGRPLRRRGRPRKKGAGGEGSARSTAGCVRSGRGQRRRAIMARVAGAAATPIGVLGSASQPPRRGRR